MDTAEANRVAVGGFTHAVCRALKSLGMRRCSARLVQYQFKPEELRLDWYGLFWRWFRALWIARREGAEFLFEDFCSRVASLREGSEVLDADYSYQLARCELEHSNVIRAALRGEDPSLIRSGLLESIAASRRLLAVLDAVERRRHLSSPDTVSDRAPPPLGRAEAREEAWWPPGPAAPVAPGGRRGERAVAGEGGTLTALTQASPSDARDGRRALMKD